MERWDRWSEKEWWGIDRRRNKGKSKMGRKDRRGVE